MTFRYLNIDHINRPLYNHIMSSGPIKQQTVVAQVMDEIRNLIASGAYKPGDKIPTEKELAEQFGIGRSSIREAIKIFNYLGVLESRAALGTFVQERSSISTEALTWSLLLGHDEQEESIDMRGAVELWCLIRLVDRCKTGHPQALATLKELDDIVRAMESDAGKGRRDNLVEEDFRFHRAIISSSGNPLLLSIYDTLRSFLYGEISKSQSDYTDLGLIPREHRKILDDIKSGNRIEILSGYIQHIENIKIRLRNS